MLHTTALLFALALGFLLLAPLRDRRALGLLPPRLAGLLDGRDRLLVFASGVALPMAVYFFSTHPPGIITRRFGITEQVFVLWLAQSVALVVAVVLGTLQSARRQLGRRGKILALGWVGPEPGRLCFPAALLAMPLGAILPGWMAHNDMIEMAGYATIVGFVGFPLLWLLWQACGSFTGTPARKLHRSVLMHSAAPFLAVALVITAIAIPWVYSQEKAWTKQIRYEALGPDNTMFESRLEREHAEWIARDLLHRLEEVE
jgi:MFS family permease